MDDFEIYDIDNENYELYLLKKEKNIKKQKRQRKILFKNKKKGHNIIVNSTDKYLLRIFMGYLYELKLHTNKTIMKFYALSIYKNNYKIKINTILKTNIIDKKKILEILKSYP